MVTYYIYKKKHGYVPGFRNKTGSKIKYVFLTQGDGLNMLDEDLLGHASGTVQHNVLHHLSISKS